MKHCNTYNDIMRDDVMNCNFRESGKGKYASRRDISRNGGQRKHKNSKRHHIHHANQYNPFE